MKKSGTTIKSLLNKPAKKKVNLVTFKLTDEELRILNERAAKYAMGNKTGYIKYLITNVEPNAKDLG